MDKRQDASATGRSPFGLRGLKYKGNDLIYYCSQSQPTRAAWIEILLHLAPCSLRLLSQPTRTAWIEIETRRKSISLRVRRSPLGLCELDSGMMSDDEEFHEINKILAETYNYKYRRMSRG